MLVAIARVGWARTSRRSATRREAHMSKPPRRPSNFQRNLTRTISLRDGTQLKSLDDARSARQAMLQARREKPFGARNSPPLRMWCQRFRVPPD